jgi:hypothetical protein
MRMVGIGGVITIETGTITIASAMNIGTVVSTTEPGLGFCCHHLA